MATSVYKFAVFIVAFLYLALFLPFVIGEEGFLENGFCHKFSGTWKGICLHSSDCDKQCREKEEALGGGCRGISCWCKYNHCGMICRKPSGIWKGPCLRSDHCDEQCTEKENAGWGGHCDYSLKCQCLVDC